MAKDGGEIMGPAELKPLLHLAKRKAVSCAIGMTKDKQGVILLHKRTKPRKLMAELLRQGKGSGLELDRTTIRFGRASVDGGSDSSTVVFTVNKSAPGPLRMALIAKLRPAGFQRCEIVVDEAIENESDEDEPEEGEEDGPAAQLPHPDTNGAGPSAPAATSEVPASSIGGTQTSSPATSSPDTMLANGAGAPVNAPQATGAQPDAGALKATLRGLAEQIRPVMAADPSRAASLVKLATAARDGLGSGDLAGTQAGIEALRKALPPAGNGVAEAAAGAARGPAPPAPDLAAANGDRSVTKASFLANFGNYLFGPAAASQGAVPGVPGVFFDLDPKQKTLNFLSSPAGFDMSKSVLRSVQVDGSRLVAPNGDVVGALTRGGSFTLEPAFLADLVACLAHVPPPPSLSPGPDRGSAMSSSPPRMQGIQPDPGLVPPPPLPGQLPGFDIHPDAGRPTVLGGTPIPDSLRPPAHTGSPPPDVNLGDLQEAFPALPPQGPTIMESQDSSGLTRPSGPIGGVPSGPRSKTRRAGNPDNKAQRDSENYVGDALARNGYRAVQNPTEGANPPLTPERLRAERLNDRADPDLLIEDRIFDTYTPEKDDASSVRNGIAEKISKRQTDRVVLDLRNTTQTEASVRAALRNQPVEGLKEVIVVTEEGVGQPFRPLTRP